MNTQQLRRELKLARIRADSYSINGATDETYCLEQSGDSWLVYYYERGIQSGKKTFASEAEACEHFLGLLMKDPTTKEP